MNRMVVIAKERRCHRFLLSRIPPEDRRLTLMSHSDCGEDDDLQAIMHELTEQPPSSAHACGLRQDFVNLTRIDEVLVIDRYRGLSLDRCGQWSR